MKEFVVTIDTEGDCLWNPVSRSYGVREIHVDNARYIERFQNLCRKYKFIPTYLVNYEMAWAEPFVSLGREWAKSEECEIGMHFHAWDTPPLHVFQYRRAANNPYAGDYPPRVLREKMEHMTEVIKKQFGVRPVSHRGGRWYLDKNVMRFLCELGYIVDCSVTPGVSWCEHIGYKIYGPDYTGFPPQVFWLAQGSNKILEIPPTIRPTCSGGMWQALREKVLPCAKTGRKFTWLRPNGHNLDDMIHVVEWAEREGNYLEFMIHSSELMPGGSPVFPNQAAIEKLYQDLEALFERICQKYRGIALKEFATSLRVESIPVFPLSHKVTL